MRIQVSCTWLRSASGLTMLMGVISLLASHPSTDFLWRYLFYALNAFQSEVQFNEVGRTLNGVLGGVMLGWGCMMFYLADPAFFNQSIRNAMLSGLLVWFISDSTASYFAGIPLNIVLNILYLIIFLVPLLFFEKD